MKKNENMSKYTGTGIPETIIPTPIAYLSRQLLREKSDKCYNGEASLPEDAKC